MALKLVPFNPQWIQNTKLDVKGIYRRPRWVKNDMDEDVPHFVDGVQQWDITTPLPVRQHNAWTAKGFQFITLADRLSLRAAYRAGTLPPGTTPATYDQHQTGGPWFYKLYAAGQQELDTAEAQQLAADIAQFGVEAVETLRRRTDPNFRVPPALRPDTPPIAPAPTRPRRAETAG